MLNTEYLYVNTSELKVKIVYLFDIFSWILLLIGLYWIINNNLFLIIFITPFIFILSCNILINSGINLFYKNFNLIEHKKLVNEYWKKNLNLPPVDIYLTICGEDIYTITKSVKSLIKIEYKNKNIYILDDKGDDQVKKLALIYKINYRSRLNKGTYNKAGNLNYGLNLSKGEFICVFDADYLVSKNFIHETIPYFSDLKIAAVQTSQFSSIKNVNNFFEKGSASLEEDYYHFYMQTFDQFDSATSAGSNIIYKKSILKSINGFTKINHSEDLFTSYRLHQKGFNIKYIPLILAIGNAPDNLYSLFTQQKRWSNGNIKILFNGFLFSKKISIFKKITYLSGGLYYISQSLNLFFNLFIISILINYISNLNFINLLLFFPYILTFRIIYPNLRVAKNIIITNIFYIAYSIISIISLMQIIFNIKNSEWQTTNSKLKKYSKDYYLIFIISLIYIISLIFLLLKLLFKDNASFLVTASICLSIIISILLHIIFNIFSLRKNYL